MIKWRLARAMAVVCSLAVVASIVGYAQVTEVEGPAKFEIETQQYDGSENSPFNNREDRVLYTVAWGSGSEHVLEDYEPTLEAPLLTNSENQELKELWRYQYALPEGTEPTVCARCGNDMEHLGNFVYEAQRCGHAVYAEGDYCKADDILEVTQFYDRCGCYNYRDKLK